MGQKKYVIADAIEAAVVAGALTPRWFSRAPDVPFNDVNAPIGSPVIAAFGELLVIQSSQKSGVRPYITLPTITAGDDGKELGVANINGPFAPGEVLFNTPVDDLMDDSVSRGINTQWTFAWSSGSPSLIFRAAYDSSAPGGLWVQTAGFWGTRTPAP